ncbi:hypothetical protein BCV70DRAFT_214692 [Testicularia cyperi]|uniref:Uncharacterized protein n=1 Tax=Testicularia cyperi TaxID=1882483 RepID=A0A317XZ66_9BASI|nr:hypothetical protein BCV70DRAFT_214692 [Testicularia cyperi]
MFGMPTVGRWLLLVMLSSQLLQQSAVAVLSPIALELLGSAQGGKVLSDLSDRLVELPDIERKLELEALVRSRMLSKMNSQMHSQEQVPMLTYKRLRVNSQPEPEPEPQPQPQPQPQKPPPKPIEAFDVDEKFNSHVAKKIQPLFNKLHATPLLASAHYKQLKLYRGSMDSGQAAVDHYLSRRNRRFYHLGNNIFVSYLSRPGLETEAFFDEEAHRSDAFKRIRPQSALLFWVHRTDTQGPKLFGVAAYPFSIHIDTEVLTPLRYIDGLQEYLLVDNTRSITDKADFVKLIPIEKTGSKDQQSIPSSSRVKRKAKSSSPFLDAPV